MNLASFFDINTIAFTLFGYPMSYLELVGTIFNLWSVWLVGRGRISNWPIGLIGVVLFFVLFYQIQLYADTFEQVYYFFTGIYGWWHWSRPADQVAIKPRYSSRNYNLLALGVTLVGTLMLAYIIGNIDQWLPQYFPVPASYVYIDSLTTVMSFTATILMAQRRIECWYYWITVDVIAIWLYAVKGTLLVALLYAIFLVLAINGWRLWRKAR